MSSGFDSPTAAIDALVAARSAGRIDGARALYADDAVVVTGPETVARDRDAIRASLEAFAGLGAEFTVSAREVIAGPASALHLSAWTLRGTGPDGAPFTWAGRSADVLRRDPDGWRVTVDDPWGTGLLPESAGTGS